MRLLLHVGLNKCASTYIQSRLTANQAGLRRVGVFYGVERGQLCQYGLSRYYGFGPEAEEVRPRSFGWLARLARERGASAMIVSSEYLSLDRPVAHDRLMRDLAAEGVDEVEVLFFARPVEAWVRSLFNQYVRTVDGGRWLHSIDDFVDQVLANGAIDIAGRYQAWARAVGAERVRLIDIAEEHSTDAVLQPFEAFAGTALPERGTSSDNRGLAPSALYLTGLVRRAPRSAARNMVLAGIERAGAPLARWVPVPARYLEISPDRRARLARDVAAPFAALPRAERTQTEEAMEIPRVGAI